MELVPGEGGSLGMATSSVPSKASQALGEAVGLVSTAGGLSVGRS